MPFNINPRQSLGQNFLIDDNIARNIVGALSLNPEDVVIEVGAGYGALTKYLTKKVKHLTAVEVDGQLVCKLRDAFSLNNVEIVHDDFLKLSVNDLHKKFKTKIRVVGNIPYHLTSPILFKSFDEWFAIKDLTIMVQREVAQRILAKPNTKNYGILSVFSQYYGKPKSLFNVSPNCFYPKPKITSTVVHIQFDEIINKTCDDQLFRSVVKTTFGKRRKTLRNSLQYLPVDEKIIKQMVKTLSFPLDKRPEELTLENFLQLTQQIRDAIQKLFF